MGDYEKVVKQNTLDFLYLSPAVVFPINPAGNNSASFRLHIAHGIWFPGKNNFNKRRSVSMSSQMDVENGVSQ